MVKENIKKHKQKIQPKQAKPILYDPAARWYVEALQEHFAAVNIDKAANQLCFYHQKVLHL